MRRDSNPHAPFSNLLLETLTYLYFTAESEKLLCFKVICFPVLSKLQDPVIESSGGKLH